MIAKATLRLHLAGVLAAALALTACNPKGAADQNSLAASNTEALPPLPAALPLATGSATSIAAAPPVAALPRTRQLDWGSPERSGEDYAWIDRAYDMADAIGDAPPDYAFDYEGVSPWAWQTSDNYVTYAEPIDDGYRYYYYEPGQNTPFLVRDPYYSYGYSDGRVVAVYDGGGRALSYAASRREVDAASRYYARAEALRRAARDDNRRAVIAANWAARREVVARAGTELGRAAQQQPEWRDYRARAKGEQHWQAEQQRRATDAQRFAAWQRDDFRGTPQPMNRAADRRQAGVREAMQVQQAQALAEQQRAQAAARRGRSDQIGAEALAIRDARARVQAERLAQEQQGAAAGRRQQFDAQQREQATAAQRQQGALRQQQVREQQQAQQQQAKQQQARAAQVQREATGRQRGEDEQKRNQASAARAAVLSRQQHQLEAQGAVRQRQALEAQGAARQRQATLEAQRQQSQAAARGRANADQAARAGAARAEAARARQQVVGQARAQQAQGAAHARAAQEQAAAGARHAQAAQAAQAAHAEARAAQSRPAQPSRPPAPGPKVGGDEKRHPGNHEH